VCVCVCVWLYVQVLHEHARTHASLVAIHTRTRSKQKLLAVLCQNLASFRGAFCCVCICKLSLLRANLFVWGVAQGFVAALAAAPVNILVVLLGTLFPYSLRAFCSACVCLLHCL
jgi:hypothetical protein